MSALGLLETMELPRYLEGEESACPLSRTQLEYVEMLAQGERLIDVARTVFRSPRTVINQLSMARARAECKTNEQLVARAIREGWVKRR